MRTSLRLPAALLLAVLVTAGLGARADVPHTLGYQGRLLTADGNPATGVVPVTYALFDQEEGGAKLWSETQSTALTDGYYAAFLGSVTPFPDGLFDGAGRYLQVTVDGEDLLPRQRVASVAFSLRAQTALNVQGGTVDATRISVGGHPVIDDQGHLTGSASYSAGSGIRIDSATNAISLADGCQPGEVLRWSGSAWQCAAAGSPVTVGSGLVLNGDRLSLPGTCAANQLLKWTGTTWACAADVDTNTTYTAGNGVELNGTTFGLLSTCASGELLKWNGSAWACAADVDTNTTYTAGSGVELKGSAFGLLSTCANGEMLKWNGNAWACAADVDTNTTYTAGSGLELNGTTFRLPTSCAQGEMLKWNGSAWACAVDVDTDTNTTYTAGSGVELSGGAFGLLSTCASGEMLKWNGSAWACAADRDTTYTAGSGLELSGTTFRLPTSCGAGQMLKWDGSAWACAADVDTNTTYRAGDGLVLDGTTFHLPTCVSGELLKWVNGGWTCSIDNDTNTTYSAGNGLVLTGTQFSLGAFPAIGTQGTAPSWSTSSSPPTLQIPLASAMNVTAGLLSNADWSRFAEKVDRAGDTMRGTLIIDLPPGDAHGQIIRAAPVQQQDLTTWQDYTSNTLASVDASGRLTASGLRLPTGAGSGLVLVSDAQGNAQWTSLSVAGALTGLSVSAPLTTTGGSNPTIALGQASGSTSGYLSAVDWNRFNSKQDTLVFNPPLSMNGSQVSITQANSFTDGFLSAIDWLSFARKFGPDSQVGPGQLWVGTTSYSPTVVTMHGDATISADGTLALAATTVTPGVYTRVTVDAKGRVLQGGSLLASDIPALDTSALASGTLPVARGGTGATSAAQGTVFAGPTSGSGAPGFRPLALGDLPAGVATQWTTNGTAIGYTAGSVGIGTTSPAATLDVNGAIKAATVANTGTAINFAGGNLQSTSASCGAMTLNNMQNGATYSLAVQGTAGGTCSFSAYSGSGTGALTVKAGPVGLTQTAGKHAIFSFMVVGGVVYVASVDGY